MPLHNLDDNVYMSSLNSLKMYIIKQVYLKPHQTYWFITEIWSLSNRRPPTVSLKLEWIIMFWFSLTTAILPYSSHSLEFRCHVMLIQAKILANFDVVRFLFYITFYTYRGNSLCLLKRFVVSIKYYCPNLFKLPWGWFSFSLSHIYSSINWWQSDWELFQMAGAWTTKIWEGSGMGGI